VIATTNANSEKFVVLPEFVVLWLLLLLLNETHAMRACSRKSSEKLAV